MTHHLGTTPTLDDERTDQLRTFLTVEAAADAATTPAPSRQLTGRRLAGGLAAAALLGAGLFAAAAVTGGTDGRGPAGVSSAGAVTIERADGWTTVRIDDIDADPQAVLDELHDAGIDARLDDLLVTTIGDQVDIDRADDPAMAFAVFKGTGDDGLAGLSVSLPEGTTAPWASDGGGLPSDGSSAEIAEAMRRLKGQMEEHGIRFGDDGSVSIRNGSGNRVLVVVQHR